MSNTFPCPNCILLALCKARCAHEESSHQYTDGLGVFLITTRMSCSLLHDYLGATEINMEHLEIIRNFYKGSE